MNYQQDALRAIKIIGLALGYGLGLSACAASTPVIYKCEDSTGHIEYVDGKCPANTTSMPLDIDVSTIRSNAEMEEGMAAFEKGNYEQAYRKLKLSADRGVPMAQNILGRMYFQGQGVSKSPEKALALFRKAASKGLANAQNNLGVIYASGLGVEQNYEQSVYWFKKSAEQGFKIAMSNLADMYEQGLGVNSDQEQADKWRKKSQGLAPAKTNEQVKIKTVGEQEYLEGLEDYYRYDYASAAQLFLQAAQKGNPEAQLMLASMYQHGQGVQMDEAQAKYWTEKAESAGHSTNDNRDRVFFIDPSEANFEEGDAAGSGGLRSCGCPEGTPFGQCVCSVSTAGDCSCGVE